MDPYGFGPDFQNMFKPPYGSPKKTEKGLPWQAKRIDGKLYVPIDQVHELLEINDVLPAVRRGLEKHLTPKENENG